MNLRRVSLSLISINTCLWDRHEGHQRGRDDQVDAEEPAQKNEVGGHGRAELRLDLLDASLPRHEDRFRVYHLAFQVLPILWK
ncbi:unnamed protein product [Trichogramma brassicae]|uniref:Uncharacterized protein n=1 Tax=Trichogramma brassicae TaxID=86971 RepID=A0A6H5IQA5_9HYME|nr:unnamed protein product [Trichogramma brassicae]